MKHILVLGAGLSSATLIQFLLSEAGRCNWLITIGDKSEIHARQKANNHPNSRPLYFDVFNYEQRVNEIRKADIVISMLPSSLHHLVAQTCVALYKHLITPSYISEPMQKLDSKARMNGVLLLNELGLDPGIDHIAAMELIDNIKAGENRITAFKSYTGGLVAPDFDNNPWNYKFTWNPKNVVLAGQGVSKYIENGECKYVPYHRLFTQTEEIKVLQYGTYEAYPNRNSLQYVDLYGLHDVPTLIRGTLRRPGFCEAWNIFVQLGITDDTYKIANSENMSYRELVTAFLPGGKHQYLEKQFADFFQLKMNSEIMKKMQWLGIFSLQKSGINNASPAEMLLHLLQKKWQLYPDDKDMIVMQLQIEYVNQDGIKKRKVWSMVVEGANPIHTAMAQTVGYPVGIAVKLILEKKIELTGVQIPTRKEIYEPVMRQLNGLGIQFKDEKQPDKMTSIV